MAELAALQVGHHSSTPAHPNLNKGQPGTWTNISRHAHPVARARPTTHARLHPVAAQRWAAWRKPKRRERQGSGVCAPGLARIGTTSSNSKCIAGLAMRIPRKRDIPIIHTRFATGLERLRPASH